jgi:hypothetical protein
MKDTQPLGRPKEDNIKIDFKGKEERGFIWHRIGSRGGML